MYFLPSPRYVAKKVEKDSNEHLVVSEYEHKLAEASTAPSGPLLGPSQPHPKITNQSLLDSNSRSLIHEITLPPIPNLDIPPSPPGSPDSAANSKFPHFATLKTQGIHFNAKLATSSSLKNPNLLQTMMKHAGISEDEQYSSSLSDDIWDPSELPQWGFKEELLKEQKNIRARVDEGGVAGQRRSVEFVASGTRHAGTVYGKPDEKSLRNG